MQKIYKTVSFHITKPCNMSCKYCYATFNDMKRVKMMRVIDAASIIDKLADAGVEKITFAGGEPMLYPSLNSLIHFTKGLGITTSIITNGSYLTREWLDEVHKNLDWVGISIDSLNPDTNRAIGRVSHTGEPLNYYDIIKMVKEYDIKIKINTVVNGRNFLENDLPKLIDYSGTERWKIFQTLRVEGQNDKQFDNIKANKIKFKRFLSYNDHPSIVSEDNELMTGSYALIDPQGRLFENTKGIHTYSDSLITNTVQDCVNQLEFKPLMFKERGGIYNW